MSSLKNNKSHHCNIRDGFFFYVHYKLYSIVAFLSGFTQIVLPSRHLRGYDSRPVPKIRAGLSS